MSEEKKKKHKSESKTKAVDKMDEETTTKRYNTSPLSISSSKKKTPKKEEPSKPKHTQTKLTKPIETEDKEITANFIDNFDGNKKWSISELLGLKKELEQTLKTCHTTTTTLEEDQKKYLDKIKEEEVDEEEEEEDDEMDEQDEDDVVSEEEKRQAAPQSEFWNYIETYFVPITQEKLNILSTKNIKPESVLEIPPLGRHYSEQWNEEDSSLFYDSDSDRPRKKVSSLKFDELLNLESSAEAIESHSLTQRLISSLFEEKKKPSSSLEDPYDMQEPNVGTHDYTPHALQYFEDKMVKELRSLGIITNELDVKNKQDEICTEIQNLQDQLRQLHGKNEDTRTALYNRVKESLPLEKKMQKRWQEIRATDKEYKTIEKRSKKRI